MEAFASMARHRCAQMVCLCTLLITAGCDDDDTNADQVSQGRAAIAGGDDIAAGAAGTDSAAMAGAADGDGPSAAGADAVDASTTSGGIEDSIEEVRLSGGETVFAGEAGAETEGQTGGSQELPAGQEASTEDNNDGQTAGGGFGGSDSTGQDEGDGAGGQAGVPSDETSAAGLAGNDDVSGTGGAAGIPLGGGADETEGRRGGGAEAVDSDLAAPAETAAGATSDEAQEGGNLTDEGAVDSGELPTTDDGTVGSSEPPPTDDGTGNGLGQPQFRGAYPAGPYFPETDRLGDLELPFSDAESVSLAELRAPKATRLIVLYAGMAWCGTCRYHMEQFQYIQDEFVDQGVEVVSVIRENANRQAASGADAEAFAGQRGFANLVTGDPNGVLDALMNRVLETQPNALRMTALIDPETMAVLSLREELPDVTREAIVSFLLTREQDASTPSASDGVPGNAADQPLSEQSPGGDASNRGEDTGEDDADAGTEPQPQAGEAELADPESVDALPDSTLGEAGGDASGAGTDDLADESDDDTTGEAYPDGPYIPDTDIVNDLEFETSDSTLALSEVRGREGTSVIVLYAGVAWCGTCIRHLREFDEMVDELGHRGLSVVGVLTENSAGQPASGVEADVVANRYGIDGEVVGDPTGQIQPLMDMVRATQPRAFRATFLIDARTMKVVHMASMEPSVARTLLLDLLEPE